ncbi:hypothetical protein BC937DRAFT_90686 [Endogone sp. FLAS-F59071]|nr:hypothetical protein BC937DRAFT_90686 [Endogone sp. FLAS-F59071]|eukprot:RUS16892.1 hypothetical protein BC937DRAFT_90686 [Endogone sp. FLAS-F59071]
MEILRENFTTYLPKIQAAIEECEFIAIDTELTGLHKNPQRFRDAQNETLSQRYTSYREAARTFSIIQFGVCTFTWDNETHRYLAKPFNFYVFPTMANSRAQLERTLWVYQGVPYMTIPEENIYRLEQLQRLNDELPDIRVDEKSLEYMRIMRCGSRQYIFDLKRVRILVDKSFISLDVASKTVDDWLANPKPEEEYVNIVTNNGYQRRLVYQELRNSYKGLTGDGRSGFIHVRRITEKETAKKYAEKKRVFDNNMDAAVGFRKVIDMMSQSRKPIIGHNMLLDVVHLVHQFMQPLPDTIAEFKALVHGLFPKLLDTKYISAATPELQGLLPSTTLEALLFETSQEPFGNPKIGRFLFFILLHSCGFPIIILVKPCSLLWLIFSCSTPHILEMHWEHPRYFNAKAHEAGYDAYMTGFVFLRIIGYTFSKQEAASAPLPDSIEIVFDKDADKDTDVTDSLCAPAAVDIALTATTSLISAFPIEHSFPSAADAEDTEMQSHGAEDKESQSRDADVDYKEYEYDEWSSDDEEKNLQNQEEPKPEPIRLFANPPAEGGEAWQLLKEVENKVNLGRGVVAYVDFVGEEVVPSLAHVFYLTSLPPRTQPVDLIAAFQKFGKVFVDWPLIDDAPAPADAGIDSCFISFEDLRVEPDEVKQWVAETLLAGEGAAKWKGMRIEAMAEYLKRTGEGAGGKDGEKVKESGAVVDMVE